MLQAQASIYDGYVPGVVPEPGQAGAPAYRFVFSTNQLLVQAGTPEGGDGADAASGSWATIGAAQLPPVAGPLAPEAGPGLYLGTWDGVPCYAAQVGPDAVAPEGWTFVPLRALYGAFGDGFFHLAGRAYQVLEWFGAHQYCGRCATPMRDAETERARRCPECGLTSYPPVSPAVIVLIRKGNKMLLARAARSRANMHSLIAGFVEPGETLEDAVRREVKEEVGLEVANIRYFGSQQWPFPNSLMIGFLADYASGIVEVDGVEIVTARWFDPDPARLPDLPPPISIARKMIDWYVAEQQR